MQIQSIPIGQIKPAAYNPRKDLKPGDPAYDKLLKGIKEFDCVEPLVWNKRSGNLVGGHQRLKVLKELGRHEVEVSVVDLDLKREAALNVALNKIQGDWDIPKLKDLLAEMDTGEFDMELTGFDLDEIKDLFDKDPSQEDGYDAAAAAAAITNPVTKPGDLWLCGPHKLLCGDSTQIPLVGHLMGGQRARMVFTDPPYNVNYGASMKDKLRGTTKQIKNDNFKTKQDFYQFLYDALSAVRPYVTGDVYCCMSSSEVHTLQKAFQDCGGHWSTFIIWVKNSFTIGRSNYQRQYEPILYGWFEGSSHYWSGIRKLGDVYKDEVKTDELGQAWIRVEGLERGIESGVWEFPRNQKNLDHPTQKPIPLVARGIRNSSKPHDLVLDTFVGGGSTLIACEQLSRICYAMDLDPVWCDVVVDRWEKLTGKKAKRTKGNGNGKE